MTSRLFTRSALAALTVLVVSATSGCAPDVPSGEGPALVTVTKTPAEPTPSVPEGKVTRLSADSPGEGIRWDSALRDMWVPAGSGVSPGADVPDGSGWVYIDVPTDFDEVADVLTRRQVTAFPDTVVTRVADPDGVVMTRSLRNVTYTMSATDDPQAPGQTVVMVRWDAVVAVD